MYTKAEAGLVKNTGEGCRPCSRSLNRKENQQTRIDGVQSTPAPTHSQRPRVDGGMLMSAGQ